METLRIAFVVTVLVVGFPFYLYVMGKCMAAGVVSGRWQMMKFLTKNQKKGTDVNGNKKESERE